YATEHELSLYDALLQADQITALGRSAVKLKPFTEMIQVFRSKLPYLTLEDLMNDIIKTTGYIESLEASDKEEAEDRVNNIEELLNKVIAFEQNADEPPSLSEFLEEVALVADIDNVDRDDNKVLLMTLHSAKGLEFPQVYLAGMEDGLFPSYMNITSDDPMELEEERRLCYVGITRAMEELTLTCARQRMVRGETQYNAVSRFVKEIPPLLLDRTPFAKKVREEDIPSSSFTKYTKEIAKTKPYAMSAQERNAHVKPYIAGAVKNIGTIQTELDYEVGDTVRHIKFGEGTVKNIISGGRDFEVTVDFQKTGIKKMFASFAKLKKI
ncbi:MAG TPA: 3'-5' exonuclease, partial [Lachnospiraceae bacterium]|nr:3'-5' exonuclease [Lachnospiraceae bacterium]